MTKIIIDFATVADRKAAEDALSKAAVENKIKEGFDVYIPASSTPNPEVIKDLYKMANGVQE